ncbi:hypothetical protein [Nocardioides alcanivorans]|nr:hypothetical protein [Nocardioides alcanivorans]
MSDRSRAEFARHARDLARARPWSVAAEELLDLVTPLMTFARAA